MRNGGERHAFQVSGLRNQVEFHLMEWKQVLWGVELSWGGGSLLRKRTQVYKYKSRCERGYVFRMRKEITRKKNSWQITKIKYPEK